FARCCEPCRWSSVARCSCSFGGSFRVVAVRFVLAMSVAADYLVATVPAVVRRLVEGRHRDDACLAIHVDNRHRLPAWHSRRLDTGPRPARVVWHTVGMQLAGWMPSEELR